MKDFLLLAWQRLPLLFCRGSRSSIDLSHGHRSLSGSIFSEFKSQGPTCDRSLSEVRFAGQRKTKNSLTSAATAPCAWGVPLPSLWRSLVEELLSRRVVENGLASEIGAAVFEGWPRYFR